MISKALRSCRIERCFGNCDTKALACLFAKPSSRDVPRRPVIGAPLRLVANLNQFFQHTEDVRTRRKFSAPDLTVSQCGLQYLLSLAAKRLHPGCPQRFVSLSVIKQSFLTSVSSTVALRFDEALAVHGEFPQQVSQHAAAHWRHERFRSRSGRHSSL